MVMKPDEWGVQGAFNNDPVNGGYGMTTPEGWGMGYTPPNGPGAAQGYLDSLASMDPDVAAHIEQSNAQRQDAQRVRREAWSSAP
jgi:hypothetical protein